MLEPEDVAQAARSLALVVERIAAGTLTANAGTLIYLRGVEASLLALTTEGRPADPGSSAD